MPLLHSNQLIGLPVMTENETPLGTLRGFTIDVTTHAITRYYVKARGLRSVLLRDDLVIAPQQVVRITEQAMVVRDTVIPARDEQHERAPRLKDQAIPVLGRET